MNVYRYIPAVFFADSPPPHPQQQRHHHLQTPRVVTLGARTRGPILVVLPFRSPTGESSTAAAAAGAPAMAGSAAAMRGSTICSGSSSGSSRQPGVSDGGGSSGAVKLLRHASTCVSVSGAVSGGSNLGDLTDITGNSFRPQQHRQHGDSTLGSLKPYTFLPFLTRAPSRVLKGTLPVRSSTYSCHGAAAEPVVAAAISNAAAASKAYGRCGALSLPTIRVKSTDVDSGGISVTGRRQSAAGRGTTDLEWISDSLQVIAAGRPLGQARTGPRRAAQSWRHCNSEEESH